MNVPLPIRVQPGAANYFSHVGAFDQIEQFFPSSSLKQVLWIGGARAQAAAAPYLPPLFHDETRSIRMTFSGHCSESRVSDLVARGSQADLVIGLGGGSALDTAKAVAHRLQKPFVAIPTIAATCAAWTPLAVWYDDEDRALGYELFPVASHLVLVEPRILLAAPAEYLRAGIGDTLAKWYEARVLCQEKSLPLTAQLGLAAARQLKDILLVDGPSALEAIASGALSDAFVQVVDAIIAGGGLVGGLGERYTRIAAAHAIHNGLTVLPETARFLHGAKVAYGILVQLALEEKHDDLHHLVIALAQLGLPTKLAQLNVDIKASDKINALIAHTLRAHESIHLLPRKIDSASLRKALLALEAL